jgi:hypothetical protein
VTGIAIYIEGGGDTANGKAQLRQGFDALLAAQKQAVRDRRLAWRVVLCGGRNDTFHAFHHAIAAATSEVVALLVDAEEPVTDPSPPGRASHLRNRDRWPVGALDPMRLHLMTQTMETWIVADPEALASYYGKAFHAPALPRRALLDGEPKQAVYDALATATRNTQKGSYGKIKHASDLLKRLRPAVVGARCASFRAFTEWLDAAIAAAAP